MRVDDGRVWAIACVAGLTAAFATSLLVDGAAADDAASAPTTSLSGVRVDVNQASRDELETLPGIGSALAGAILEERERRGRFDGIESLDRVPGIGPATLRGLAPHVRFDGGRGDGATE